jgi:DNA primase
VPLVAQIRDASLRPAYARRLAGWVGMEVEPVVAAVQRAERDLRREGGRQGGRQHPPVAVATRRPDPRDPVTRVEREALQCLLQIPHQVPAEEADALGENAFEVPAFRAVHNAVRAAGGLRAARQLSPQLWLDAVLEQAPEAVRALVTQLAVEPIAADSDEMAARLARSSVFKLADLDVGRQIGVLHSRLQRLGAGDAGQLELLAELQAAERHRHALRTAMDP